MELPTAPPRFFRVTCPGSWQCVPYARYGSFVSLSAKHRIDGLLVLPLIVPLSVAGGLQAPLHGHLVRIRVISAAQRTSPGLRYLLRGHRAAVRAAIRRMTILLGGFMKMSITCADTKERSVGGAYASTTVTVI
jgi:hypothetical protein